MAKKDWAAYAVHLEELVNTLNNKLSEIQGVVGGSGLTLAKAVPMSFGLTYSDLIIARTREAKKKRRLVY